MLKALECNGLIAKAPEFSGQVWQDFGVLVDYRDGLVHARASRPEFDSYPSQEEAKKAKPKPVPGELEKMPRGWALRRVVVLVENLHKAVDTPPPVWLQLPSCSP